MRKAANVLDGGPDLPEGFWYSVKTRLLGPPLVNEQLGEQRLSKPLALGVLSPDGISSSAYGTEEILIALVPLAGIAAFPAVGPYKLEICVGVVLLMCYGNLRGIKEAGKAFAVPTYLFAGSVILMIVVGLVREAFGHLPLYDPATMHGTYALGSGTEGI